VTVTVEENETDEDDDGEDAYEEDDEFGDDRCEVVEESSSGVRTSGDEDTWSSSHSASGTPTHGHGGGGGSSSARYRGCRRAKSETGSIRVPFPEYGLDIVEGSFASHNHTSRTTFQLLLSKSSFVCGKQSLSHYRQVV
jgi:hypothetical protein